MLALKNAVLGSGEGSVNQPSDFKNSRYARFSHFGDRLSSLAPTIKPAVAIHTIQYTRHIVHIARDDLPFAVNNPGSDGMIAAVDERYFPWKSEGQKMINVLFPWSGLFACSNIR